MPAETAIASTPQKATRVAPNQQFAPPTFAAKPPSTAKKANDIKATGSIKFVDGINSTTSKGNAAPNANEVAEASAA